MAQNERAGHCWSQPRRSTAVKSRPSCSRGLRTDDIDSFGDIVNAFNCGDRGRQRPDSWQTSRNVSAGGCFSSSGCCLKSGRVQCSCSCPKNTFTEQLRRDGQRYPPRAFDRNTLSFQNKPPLWPDNNASNGCFQDNKMLEEFILDDNELSLLNYYEIPIDVPRRRHIRNVGKVKTVSIIDTLSELASGATDREDEGGFSSAVSESAVLNRSLYKPRTKHARPAIPRRDRNFRESYVTASLAPKIVENSATNRSSISNTLKSQNEDFHCQNFGDDGHFTCSSLKRTLKYLRKAVSTNAEEEARNRKPLRESKDEDDAFRQCFSDSEVKATPEQWPSFKKEKFDFSSQAKSKSLLTVIDPFTDSISKSNSLFRRRSKTNVPDWIQEVFCAAKKGDVEKMKRILRDIDPALVRNLSDDHGNNLWHICAVHNNFECLNWLCSQNQHHAEALKDENKNGFSPVSLAVKHGSLLAVQWLIHNTISKSQIVPQNDSRSLLHVAARYGQDAIVEWLLSYMSSHNLDASIIDGDGNTALHLASKYGHIGCVKALVFRIGCLKTKNEHGLKPLDLAVKHCKTDCADYLVALEACYNLAALNLRQHSEIQQLHKENAEVKSYFKELLALTKRLQNQQKELMQSISQMNAIPPQYERSNEKNKYRDDCSQLLATIMTDEEHHLFLVEDRWKKSKKQIKYTDSKKKPIDVLRSQFSHVLDKVSCQSPPIPSTPETSDGSCPSDDEDSVPKHMQLPEFSAPDVVNSLSPQASIPFLNSKQKSESITSHPCQELDIKPESIKSSPTQSSGSLSKVALNNRDVNLRMFFKQNPNLRQSGETCSVLEVLEPSSSDSEEGAGQKKRTTKAFNPEKEAEQSSSSSALETLSPYSCRPSSSGSKASGSRSSSNGSRHNPFSPVSDTSYNLNSHATSENSRQFENESQNSPPEVGDKGTNEQLDSSFSEPDLIKGTQKKKLPSSADKEKKSKDLPSDNNDNPSISTEDSESLEADRSFSSTTDVPEGPVPSNSETTSASTTIKKKSFLLKFALRGRWPSKTVPRSLKNEISPEEFRETYSRTALMDSVPTSQIAAGADCFSTKNHSPSKTESENQLPESLDLDPSVINERLSDSGNGNAFTMPPINDALNQTLMRSRRGLLPPRRDPPPAPPINVRDDEQSQDHSDDDMSVSIQKSSVSSCAEDCLTSSVSLHTSYLGSRSSDLWHSPDSKSLFRPASSASRVGSLTRGEENFSLNKSSSASTEMLSALDSSTAGRQSPAPSEVSKTESALSPPSDVSKTESTRYLSQLGRIEESGHLTTINVSNLQHSNEHNIKESTLNNEAKSEIKHKKKSGKKMNSDKPWYEFSDEEDVIIPQRYQAVAVSMRSSSEDEG